MQGTVILNKDREKVVRHIYTRFSGDTFDRETIDELRYVPLYEGYLYLLPETNVEFYILDGKAHVTGIIDSEISEAKVIEMFPEKVEPLTDKEIKEIREALEYYREEIYPRDEYRDRTTDPWDGDDDIDNGPDDDDWDDSWDDDRNYYSLTEKPVLKWRKSLLYTFIAMVIFIPIQLYLPFWVASILVFNMILTLFMLYQNGVRHNFAPPKIF